MMPGLPTASPERDIEDFRRLFEDPDFKPDMLKIYPTLVLKNTGLYNLYNHGKYKPYSHDDYIRILVEVKKAVPAWIRIMRVQREIEDREIVKAVGSSGTAGTRSQMPLHKVPRSGSPKSQTSSRPRSSYE